MKKHVCLILAVFVFVVSLTFVGCKNDEKRKAENLYNNYLDISISSPRLKEEKLNSKFINSENVYFVKFNFSDELQQKINTSSPYNKITTFYDDLLENISAPIVMYGKNFSSSNIDKQDTKTLYNQLDNLRSAYLDTATILGDLEATLNEPTLAENNLKQLFYSYETLIYKASILSNKVASLYFNKVMQNPNPNYLSMDDSKIDLNDIAFRTLNKLFYYNYIYTDIYVNVYIRGNTVPDKLINSSTLPSYTPYNTINNTNYSNTLKDLESNREQIINLAKSMYLIQKDFDKMYQNYHTAIEKITYMLVDDNSSIKKLGYKNTIDEFISPGGISYASFDTLTTLLDLCFVKNNFWCHKNVFKSFPQSQ